MQYCIPPENIKGLENMKKHRFDIIFLSAVIIISLSLLLLISSNKEDGALAVVEINGTVVGEYPLGENGEFTLNGGSNVLVIENGEAYMSFSKCPDHVCERTGKIRFVGESIVCLPNRVVVTIKGNADGGVDLVS